MRSGESSSHSCNAVSIAYSEPACHFDRLSPSITRWSPIPADVRYCRLRVVNVCGISYTYIRSESAAAGDGSPCDDESEHSAVRQRGGGGGVAPAPPPPPAAAAASVVGDASARASVCEQSTPNQPRSHQQKPASQRPWPEQSRRHHAFFGDSQKRPRWPSKQDAQWAWATRWCGVCCVARQYPTCLGLRSLCFLGERGLAASAGRSFGPYRYSNGCAHGRIQSLAVPSRFALHW